MNSDGRNNYIIDAKSQLAGGFSMCRVLMMPCHKFEGSKLGDSTGYFLVWFYAGMHSRIV